MSVRKAFPQKIRPTFVIAAEPVASLVSLPMRHRDPFDRMLIAQALVEGIPIVSGDEAIDARGVPRIW